MCKITTVVEFNNNLLYNLSPITDHCWASSLILKKLQHAPTYFSQNHNFVVCPSTLFWPSLSVQAKVHCSTKADDTQSRFRRRLSAPKIGADFWTVCDCVIPIWYPADFSGTRFWRRSVACSISCRFLVCT